MKYIKNYKYILIAILLILPIAFLTTKTINPSKLINDSGFDTSYDSGGSSSSSWSSSDSSGEGSSGPISLEEYGWTPILITTAVESFLVFVTCIIVNIKNKSKNIIGDLKVDLIVTLIITAFLLVFNILEIFMIPTFIIFLIIGIGYNFINEKISKLKKAKEEKRIAKLESKLLEKYNIGSINELKEEFFKIYVEIQDAWMNFDYDKLRNYCTDELYNQYVSQLEILKIKNEVNIMDSYKLISCNIIDISESKNIITVKIQASISLKDEIHNSKTKKKIKGGNYTNNYDMTFIKNVFDEVKYCPNCGAKIDDNASVECKYCHSTIVKGSQNWILSKKNISK